MAAIDAVGGIGLSHARRFRRSGIRTTEALLRRAATLEGRADLAERLSVNERELLELVLRIDLMRIRGLGTRYVDLLSAAGVSTAQELSTRDPDTLFAMMVQVNGRQGMVRRLPNLERVKAWVAEARTFQPLVEQ
ncbi:MAG: DUF4332 domain-containing protein [bacterium]|nr:DUF4332 domain-containing protein [bacterium]MDE0289660.1 DUF4332 domain-containing protein [bacterium]MDE0437934.1 DUF4332 domain-containing protein [bacterium]